MAAKHSVQVGRLIAAAFVVLGAAPLRAGATGNGNDTGHDSRVHALPPVDQMLITDVGAGFTRLSPQQEQLARRDALAGGRKAEPGADATLDDLELHAFVDESNGAKVNVVGFRFSSADRADEEILGLTKFGVPFDVTGLGEARGLARPGSAPYTEAVALRRGAIVVTLTVLGEPQDRTRFIVVAAAKAQAARLAALGVTGDSDSSGGGEAGGSSGRSAAYKLGETLGELAVVAAVGALIVVLVNRSRRRRQAALAAQFASYHGTQSRPPPPPPPPPAPHLRPTPLPSELSSPAGAGSAVGEAPPPPAQPTVPATAVEPDPAEHRPTSDPPPVWLNTAEAGERLGISTAAVRGRIARGELPAEKDGKRYRIRLTDVEPPAEDPQ